MVTACRLDVHSGAPMRTLSAIELATPEEAAQAAKHLGKILARYDAVVWLDGPKVNVVVDLQGTSTAQRMAAWRRIVTEEMETVGISIVDYE
jgi:hypothetical protein